ncbi:metallophosphoesterase [Actinoplanes hulinensis]|uniref:Metallophosphoesterase n=1 Tax=Actinoplanes hulinensis TaxID=1144547 RepID=A0ABS7B1Q4_9ACTN|nr:metallophosphoesterase [Actinoplanes hulinensis]MBW6434966.1 metallophosphoesterase [Actinoplanes hulinensis]
MFVFIIIAFAIAGLIHYYLWRRLVRDTTTSRRWRQVGAVAIGGALVTLLATMAVGDRLPSGLRWLTLPGFVWLAVMFYLLIVLWLFEVPVLVALRIRARRATPVPAERATPVPAGAVADASSERVAPVSAGAVVDAPPVAESDHDPGRRLLLRRGVAVTAGAVAVGLTGFGMTRAYRAPTIKRYDIPMARLARRADGLRLAVLADLHVGPLLGSGQVERMVEIVNGLDADVVAVVGDVVTSEPGRVRDSLLPLTRMRGRHGVFYVTGNHEYYVGAENWTEAATELDLRVLRNERVEIAHGGGVIDLAGVNDITGAQYADPPDYERTLAGRDQSRPVVLMAHQPVAVHDAAPYGVDLQLSGHTHGGQMFPFDYLVGLQQPVVSGFGEVDGTPVYVTNGAGFWGPPVRVGADPDITLLTLRSTA